MKIKIFILVFVAFMSGHAIAQENDMLFVGRRSQLKVGMGFKTWKVQHLGYPITQLYMPIKLYLPVGDSFSFGFTHTPAYSWWYENYKVFGLSDTWISGTYITKNERLMLNVGFGLPTGKTRLSKDELEVTKFISENIYRFDLPAYGQGLSFNYGFALALPIGDAAVIGLGGQWINKSGYVPFHVEKTDEQGLDLDPSEVIFKPGSEATAHVGLDLRIGDDMKIMIDGLYTYFWEDKAANIVVYKAGGKFTLNVGWYYRFYNKYIWTHFRYREKGKNESLQGLAMALTDFNTNNGYQFETDILFNVFNFRNAKLLLVGEGRFYGKNELGEDEEAVLSFGLGVTANMSPRMEMDIRLLYMFGKSYYVVSRSLVGYELYITLNYEL